MNGSLSGIAASFSITDELQTLCCACQPNPFWQLMGLHNTTRCPFADRARSQAAPEARGG